MDYRFWFANAQGISDREKRRLLQVFGREEEIFSLTEAQTEKLKLLSPRAREALLAARRDTGWQKKSGLLREQGISLVCWQDKEYPERLKNLYDPPYCLYVRGRLPPQEQKTVALVGARSCSEYGRAAAETIAGELALHGVGVISGMAYGIDAAAHVGALKARQSALKTAEEPEDFGAASAGSGAFFAGRRAVPSACDVPASADCRAASSACDVPASTYAVLGCGVDVCYPAAHRRLYEQMVRTGGVISEVPLGCPPLRHFFPRRNRIISGLADAVVVVEAREKSGSLITADCALEQGKLVYAVPGRISDDLSCGANWLLSQGASVLYSIREFLRDLKVEKQEPEKLIENSLEKNERLVYSVLDFTPKHLETLLADTGLALEELLKVLYRLSELGCAKEIHQNYYIKSKVDS